MPTVQDVFFEVMRDLELTTVFGNPGSTEEDFLARFPSDFRYVLGLQEASVLAMADGYAQSTGKPAFVNLHTAPGLGNALGNLVTAYMNRTPLIVTAGQQTREMLLMEPWLSNVDATRFAQPHVKWAYEPVRAQDLPAALVRAYACAVQPPQGPVFLSLPLDDWSKPAGPKPAARRIATRVAPDPLALRAVAEALAGAKRPALLAGAGIDRAGAWTSAVRLAERTGAAVFSPPASERAGFPEDHAQFAGTLPFAIAPLAQRLSGHDVVLVIGAPVFRYYPYVAGDYLPAGTQLFHVTDDPDEAARAPVGHALIGDAGLALDALLDLLPDRSSPPPSPPTLARAARAPSPRPAASIDTHRNTPMTADELFAAIASVRPDDAVIVEESPSNLAALRQHLPTRRPASFFTMASGGLGFGLPAAVGIAMAQATTSRRPVIAVIGDGSFNYSIQALATAAQERARLVVIVPRNHAYGILKAFAREQRTPGVPGLDLPPFDLCGLARAYGCRAESADTPDAVAEMLTRAWAHDGTTVIEAVIDPAIPPLL